MSILRKFIDAGYYTIPLGGSIRRLEGGTKSLPTFEKNWQNKYKEERNTTETNVAGLFTGELNGIMAIDCDNKDTLDLFQQLNPGYDFIFYSKGKPKGGGTILYKYDPSVYSFRVKTELIELDVFSNTGMIYLPTAHNESKHDWENKNIPELQTIPKSILILLKSLNSKITAAPSDNKYEHQVINKLAPLVQAFVDSKQYDERLFKILTPKSFRKLKEYQHKGHLHPNKVPEGEGSEYLSKVSCILGADVSVSVELYCTAMAAINNLWDNPMPSARLYQTVISPMINSQTQIENEVVWKYDKDWDIKGIQFIASNKELIESFYDDVKQLYMTINYSVPYVKTFTDKNKCIQNLATLGRRYTQSTYDQSVSIIRTKLEPHLSFGHIIDTDKFNLFNQSKYLSALNGNYEEYRTPELLLRYLETFIPDEKIRIFVMRFLRTKLTTFDFSPIILYFIGVSGSGKDTFVNIIKKIIGDMYVASPSAAEFVEQYNGWLLDKFFVHCNEYGNELKPYDRDAALGRIKKYTGAQEIQIRAMRSDGYNYTHNASFILTANKNPLAIELDDRRICFINTPNYLKDQAWVQQAGGLHIVMTQIQNEIYDFCCYLHAEYENLTGNEYNMPPYTADKQSVILDSLPPHDLLVYYFKHKKYEELKQLFEEHNIELYALGWDKQRLMSDKLSMLYDSMTNGRSPYRALVKSLKRAGFTTERTTYDNGPITFYILPGLHKYAEVDFSQDDDNIQLKI